MPTTTQELRSNGRPRPPHTAPHPHETNRPSFAINPAKEETSSHLHSQDLRAASLQQPTLSRTHQLTKRFTVCFTRKQKESFGKSSFRLCLCIYITVNNNGHTTKMPLANGGTFQPLQHRTGTLRERLHSYTKRTLGAGGSINEAVRTKSLESSSSTLDATVYVGA